MAESSLEGFSDRTRLRRALAHRLSEVQPELRVLAEGFLAEVSTIDLLAVGPEGELVSIRFSKPEDDRATLTRGLADLTWLRTRRADFLKLSPGLGIDPSAEPRALVFCHDFSAETLAAVDNFPENTVSLWRCRGLFTDTGQVLLVEPTNTTLLAKPWPAVLSATTPKRAATPGTVPANPSTHARRPSRELPLADPPSPSAFRSGLVDADLAPHGGRESERFHALDAEID